MAGLAIAEGKGSRLRAVRRSARRVSAIRERSVGGHGRDSDGDAGAPLAGVRVVSMALNAPGPLAVARLAAAGAHVTKIEPPAGDPLAGSSAGSWYDELHRRRARRACRSQESRRAGAACRRSWTTPTSSSAVSGRQRLRVSGSMRRPSHRALVEHRRRTRAARGRRPRSHLSGARRSARRIDAADARRRRHGIGTRILRRAVAAASTGRARASEVGLYDSLDSLVAPLKHGLTATRRRARRRSARLRHLPRARRSVSRSRRSSRIFESGCTESLDLEPESDLTDVMQTRTAEEWEQWALERDLPISSTSVCAFGAVDADFEESLGICADFADLRVPRRVSRAPVLRPACTGSSGVEFEHATRSDTARSNSTPSIQLRGRRPLG